MENINEIKDMNQTKKEIPTTERILSNSRFFVQRDTLSINIAQGLHRS